MKLPSIRRGGKRPRCRDLGFTGLDRREVPAPGALEDCENLSADRWPLLSPRRGREQLEVPPGTEDFFRWDGRLILAAGETLYLDGQALGHVAPGQKRFCAVNSRLCVFPDKVILDLRTGDYARMDETLTLAGDVTLTPEGLTAPSEQSAAREVPGTELTGAYAESAGYEVLLYTYGRDREAVSACWREGAWDLEALGRLEQTAGLLSRGSAEYELDAAAAGGIFIPGETEGGVFDYVLGSVLHGVTVLPDRSAYNASGCYAVLTAPVKREILHIQDPYPGIRIDVQWRFDVYRAGASNPLFSGVLRAGEAVDITGTRWGFGDGEKLLILEVSPEDNGLKLPEGSFTLPMACCLLEEDLRPEESCSLEYGGLWYRFSAGEGAAAGQVLYLLEGDGTHVYLWDPALRRTLRTMPAAQETSPGEGRKELAAETYDPGSGEVTLRRSVPDLDFVCACGGRLWGVSNRQENRVWDPEKEAYVTYTTRCVYASALGEPTAFWRFQDQGTDAWQSTVDGEGDFTALCPWDGGVLCWKERELVRVSGGDAREFRVSARSLEGPMAGCDRSLTQLGSALYYLSRSGVRVWSGGEPALLSAALGDRPFRDGTGGTDGRKYWLSLREGENWSLLTYDSRSGVWLREDDTRALRICRSGGRAELLRADGTLLVLDGAASDPGESGGVAWSALFARFPEDAEEEKKRCLRLLLRLELSPGGAVTVEADTGEGWRTLSLLSCQGDAPEERMAVIPVWPHRTDRLRLRLRGRGPCAIMSLAREYRSASIYG